MTEFQELVKNAPSFESMEHGELVAYAYAMFAAGTMADAENTKLRERITTQKQTIQAYRGESREWREEAERAQAENDRLREQLDTAKHNQVRNAREYLRLCHENDRLQELVTDYERCTEHVDCSTCEYDGKLSTHCPLSPCFPDSDELSELGIEVD